MNYKVLVKDKEITYGPLITKSRFNDEEWLAIYNEMVKVNQPELYEMFRENQDYIRLAGYAIDLEERYEALLELLPQNSYSRAGTHPQWIADAVDLNTLNKGITQDDVRMFINQADSLEELQENLRDYFDLEQEEE